MENINKIIEETNQRILEYNKKIENIEASRNKIKEKFWDLMQIRFATIISDYNKKKKERTCFSFLSISDSGISAWGVYRRNLRWRKESKGG